MVPPPWGLLSSTGEPHDAADVDELKALAKTYGVVDKSRTNLLAILVGALSPG